MSVLSDILPTIATTLGGPLAGLAVETIGKAIGLDTKDVAVVKNVLEGMPPEKLAQLRQIDADLQVKLAALGYDSTAKLEELNLKALQSVNETMQVESKSEHWQVYSWRPFIGFTFGLYIASMFMLPLFGKTPTTMSPDLVMAVGGVLGVASWFRGKMQVQKVKTKGDDNE